jgi:hypothetical protein
MKTKFTLVHDFLFDNWEFVSLMATQNLKRMLYFSPILILIHIVHVLLFWLGKEGSRGVELAWKQGIIEAHIVGALAGFLFGAIALYLVIQKKN